MRLIRRLQLATRVLPLALSSLVVFGWGARPASAQFTIDELELHIIARPGETLTRLIPIRSEIDSVQQVRINVKDWVRDSAGGNVMSDYGSLPSSCGARLQVFPLTLQLGPRATEFVRVTYELGADLPELGCWALALGETVRPPRPRVPGASVTITTLIGVKVYVHRPDAVLAGSIRSADVEEFWERKELPDQPVDSSFVRQVAVRFENTGTAHLRVKSSVEIRDEATQIIARLDGAEAYITPNGWRDVLVRLPELRRGRYAAVILLDYGGEEITAAQVEFAVP